VSVSYNPHKAGDFYDRKTNQPIHHATAVLFSADGSQVKQI
jgi:hypothetical protein